ncbi:MAG: MFS transporter [Bacteroidales bacterium]|nr:MFS transporter [Bacteroidales bacterium]
MSASTSVQNPRKALLALCIAAFLVPFMGSALNLALPDISQAFSLKAVTLTWMATSYMISTAIFQIPFARLGDLIGRRKVFISGVIGFSVCTFVSGFACSGAMLLTLRFLSGMFSAMMFGTNIAILSSLFPPEKRGRALGINTAVVYASLAAGPLLGGVLTHYLGWQSIFFVSGAIGCAAAAMARFFLTGEWIESKGEPFDYTGALIYAIALTGVIFGCTQLPKTLGFVSILIGITAIAAFANYEQKCAFPLFNVKLFSHNRIFALSSLSALINYASTSAIIFMLSLYLQHVRGFSAQYAGFIIISQACMQAIFALLSGRLSDRIAPSVLATFGMAIITLGLVGLIFLHQHTSVYYIIFLLLLLGVGFGIFASPNTNVIMGSVDKKYYGQASAVTGTMRLTGQALSMGIAGMAIALQMGNQKITPDLHPQFLSSMQLTFIIFAVLCSVGVYASSKRKIS